MSASPTLPSTKRPLEDPSSPSATDLPDAKRPALDKPVKEDEVTNGTPVLTQETQPILSTASHERSPTMPPQDESQWIHIRAVISSAEAATVIGKSGLNVAQIRKLSNAKCTVSDYSRGAVERILTVSGKQDAVAKAFGLIIRTLNDENLEESSTAQSKSYPLRLLIPQILIGAIIGRSGVRVREVQDASGARLNVSDSCLPLSTERSLVILGVADAVHIAVYYVASTLVEQLTERFGGPGASAYAARSGGPAGVVPGGMQVVPYIPQLAGGQYGHPDQKRPRQTQSYGPPQHGSPRFGAPQPSYPQNQPQVQPQPNTMPGQTLTQQIWIPSDSVGAIIGKQGIKINEIRHLSGSVIKISENTENSNERLVTVTGTTQANQMALYMLYARLENEKHRQ